MAETSRNSAIFKNLLYSRESGIKTGCVVIRYENDELHDPWVRALVAGMGLYES